MTGKEYSVYEHVFPNGKRYIGITNNIDIRWRKGEGYKGQEKIYGAIEKYGWGNIQHNIIVSGIGVNQAKKLEEYLIKTLDTIENGYNVNRKSGYKLPSDIEMIVEAISWQKEHRMAERMVTE